MFSYRGYLGSSSYSEEDGVFYGKIEGIYDLVSYESDKETNLEDKFCNAVDEYIEFCKEVGKEY